MQRIQALLAGRARYIVMAITLLIIVFLIYVLMTHGWWLKNTKILAPPVQTKIKEILWNDLRPEPEKSVLERFYAGKMSDDEVIAYSSKLDSQVIETVNNTYGKIPGYLVPLNMNKNQIATELLLVPTLGACIHVPPPPPNQIVYIAYPKGIKVTEAAYKAYWVLGTIRLEIKKSEYSQALYSMDVEQIAEYKENEK